jgi:hypothetical protein
LKGITVEDDQEMGKLLVYL